MFKTLRPQRHIASLASASLMAVIAFQPAFAGTISETVSYPSTPTEWSTTLDFAGFNSFGLGGTTLDSVTIALTETLSGLVTLTNESGSTSVVYFTFVDGAELDSGSLGEVTNSQSSPATNIGPNSVISDLAITGSSTAYNIYDFDLSQFLGAWTATAEDSTISAAANYGDVSSSSSDDGALSVAVTYTYSGTPQSVPEPSTMEIFGTALLGFAGFRLLSRRTSAARSDSAARRLRSRVRFASQKRPSVKVLQPPRSA